MGDSDSFKTNAIIYAVLRLAVRLVGAQSYALGLWFSRRSYERSRGEMITMLYEKTLSRKIIGTHAHLAEFSDERVDNSLQGSAKSDRYAKLFWRKLSGWMNGPSASESRSPRQPASMGKILNLMR